MITRASSTARPLVSVLTPSFEQANWLPDNLRSVAEQRYPSIEHIVMDGGSTDGSQQLLRDHESTRLSWKSEPDRGQSHALNKAFAQSQGEIIGWLNSDDAYFGPDVVEAAVDVFEREPDVAVVYGHALLVNAAGRIMQVLWVPRFDRSLLCLHDFVIQPAAFIRRKHVGEVFVDESFDFSMDYELWLRLSRKHRFRRLDQIVAIDRHHQARKSYTMMDVGDADHQRLATMYGVRRGPIATGARKAWKIMSRVTGARLVGPASNRPVVFNAIRDDPFRLLVRQLVAPRATMSTEER